MHPIRIVIADDHALVSEGLQSWLQEDEQMHIVGIAKTGKEALHLAQTLVPDVLIQDLRLPDMYGLEVVRRVRSLGIPLKIIILSGSQEFSVRESLGAGANAFCSKEDPRESIITALRWVMTDASVPYISPGILKEYLHGEEAIKRAALTETELLVLKNIKLPNKDIAAKLFMAEGTVRNHISSIYTKIGASSRVEAIDWTVHHGLFTNSFY